jgi:hypothetical protein
MDGRGTRVSAVLVEGGRVVALDPDEDRSRHAETVIDLANRVVVPGIIDSHNHIVLMGNRPGMHTPLETAWSIQDLQSRYAARIARMDDDSWVTTIGGFHPSQFAERRLPTRDELDEVSTDVPIFAMVGFKGQAATNSPGRTFLEERGVRVDDNGAIAAGEGSSTAALLAVRRHLLGKGRRTDGMREAIDYCLSVGITSHVDQGAFPRVDTDTDGAAHEDNHRMYDPLLDLHRRGELTARVQINFLHHETDLATPGLRGRLRYTIPFFGDEMLETGGVGEYAAAGTGENLRAACRLLAEAGWRAEIHSGSATDYVEVIEAFESAHSVAPVSDLRWVLAHGLRITEPWMRRLMDLGGGISLTGREYLGKRLPRQGPPYAGPPFRTVLESGVTAGLSSDGAQVAPMNPWLHVYYATTGLNTWGEQINPDQQVGRLDAIAWFTNANGWFMRREHELGRLLPGHRADLAVLSDDFVTIPDEALKDVHSVLTMVGGKVVFQRPGAVTVTSAETRGL